MNFLKLPGRKIILIAMGFSLGDLLYVSVLLLNAICVLSEDRFLARSIFNYSELFRHF